LFYSLGAILGLCFVAGLIGLFICIQQRRRKAKSKNGSTDTLKANSNGNQIEHFHATPVRVVDTNSCLYYPAHTSTINEGLISSITQREKKTINHSSILVRSNGTLFYNQEISNGIYSIQGESMS
jgi:hypothetical protein